MSSSQKANHKELTSASSYLEPHKYSDASKDSQAMDSVNNLCRQYEEKVRPCIDLIDSLRALGVEQDLALPAIAVIGDQSSGKSSVLEALSGVELPRGSGIITRCPLVLKLKQLKDGGEWKGKVTYRNTEVELSDPSKVEEEINKAQNFIAGKGLEISSELVSLDVSSPNVPDLTLIDLPGITRVAVGNQPIDIGHQIKELIKTYIKKQETINLVVVPSNVDIATTEALSMAQEVDPEGDRTIGILTKPDLVDRGAEDKVVDVVRNLVVHLKKGYMIVKCRGQQDIQKRMNLAEALKMEQAFFEEHPHFRVLLKDGKATVPCLAERLTTELISHICKSLPLLENQIKEMYQSADEELLKYGTEIPEDSNERTFFLIDVRNIVNIYFVSFLSWYSSFQKDQSWFYFLKKKKSCKMVSVKTILSTLGSAEIGSQIKVFENQYRGRELPGFMSYKTFENIIKKQIKALEEPAVDMLHKVTGDPSNASSHSVQISHNRLVTVFLSLQSKIEDIRLKQEKKAEELIRLQFQMEHIVYCQDQVYKGALKEVRENEAEKENNVINSQPPQKDLSITEMTQHLNAYYQVSVGMAQSH
ncbi:Interferon-induced GTP-binding protein Mx1 [Lemmus lemmus]